MNVKGQWNIKTLTTQNDTQSVTINMTHERNGKQI